MNKNWKSPDMDKFAVFILCHGRPNYNDTYRTLKRSGYSGKIFIICDNLDSKNVEYIRLYGDENVFIFNKPWTALESDAMNNFGDMRATLFVRNASFDIARELCLDYFLELDDDYGSFCHKREECERTCKRLDEVFSWFVEYLINTPIKSIAFSQGGDHIGGYNPDKMYKRKAMNSFFCLTSRPFKFYGTMNDDVNMYVTNGMRGDIYLTFYPFMLHQAISQQNVEGLTEIYKKYGTYVKSFYTIMCTPSSSIIRLMGEKNPRLHHAIKWTNAVPCIIRQEFKKQF